MTERRIAVFTATRAEYGLLRRVMFGLREAPDCVLLPLVSGTHLSAAHGHTLDEISADGFTPAACVDLHLAGHHPCDVAASMGRAVQGVAQALAAVHPDLCVILGDRYESCAAAMAASLMLVPVAHIHGGETTEGAVDEAFRHCMTKMSHVHFTSCEVHRQRVIQLGEHPDRVWNVGALGVENVHTLTLPDAQTLRQDLQLGAAPYVLGTFHPVTLEAHTAAAQLEQLLTALEALPDHMAVLTGANADAGGADINARLQAWAEAKPARRRFHLSLGLVRYLAAAREAECVVGNSSSGIGEVPSLGTPVVDVGDRQKGRVRSAAVLHCEPNSAAILATIHQALSPEHRAFARSTPSPFDRAGTAAAIVQALRTYPLDGLLKKTFYDLPPAP